MLGLVLFRLFWGLLGSSTARFAGFVRGPARVLRYLRGRTRAGLGHNPLGGWSVVLMLLLLLTQVGLGLFAIDEDGLVGGPLSHLVSYETARTLAHRHETVFYVLLAADRPPRRGDPLSSDRRARRSGHADGHRQPPGAGRRRGDGRRRRRGASCSRWRSPPPLTLADREPLVSSRSFSTWSNCRIGHKTRGGTWLAISMSWTGIWTRRAGRRRPASWSSPSSSRGARRSAPRRRR